ncbi:hypothetical protein NNJEOMEG_03878 [Fundidesulfovibrio magnetotacticus]|uniref:Uncharacterized protein n=1 Tax=Fundidesulfovibrio magnetotacticus TaxID=2730080 RepID=A0A6V8LW91_9BACT|nr:hypothetical protein [Fundidesulfovibrio magnetotacticus]GFK96004.1 hypothetical protein NNJEOMEG_03878 [Fundidesulfovibrio magnetotacticus]
MSLYSLKTGAAGAPVQSWSASLGVSSAGDKLAKLAALYDKRPETTLSGAFAVPAIENGPVAVARFGDLTLNGATITTDKRCNGLFLLCDSLTVTGAASVIHMDHTRANRAFDPADADCSIPASLVLSSRFLPLAGLLAMIRQKNIFVGDPQFWLEMAPLVTCTITPGPYLSRNSLCGAAQNNYANVGNAGTGGPGGAGGSRIGWGERGRWCRGGYGNDYYGTAYHNPETLLAMSNPGGFVVVAVIGNVTVGPGLTIHADGGPTSGVDCSGAGGGLARLLHGGTLTGSPTVRAAAGAGGGGTYGVAGGAGFAGASGFTAFGL